jgi:hypothetical protein
MSVNEPRQRILEFLEGQLFRPVLDEGSDRHPVFRRDQFKALRASVRREREGIHGATSANAMVLAFREAAQRSADTGLDARLRGFELPTFASIRDEFEKLAAALAVPGRPEPAGFPD